MNIDELFRKYSRPNSKELLLENILTKMDLRKAMAEIISQPPDVKSKYKIKKGGSGQPMKDFEKAFYFNWETMFLEDEMRLFYRVKKWFGEWCEKNIENFSA